MVTAEFDTPAFRQYVEAGVLSHDLRCAILHMFNEVERVLPELYNKECQYTDLPELVERLDFPLKRPHVVLLRRYRDRTTRLINPLFNFTDRIDTDYVPEIKRDPFLKLAVDALVQTYDLLSV